MIKAVVMTSVHPRDDVRIFHKESRSLVQGGYRVVLLARGSGSYFEDGILIRGIGEPRTRFGRLLLQPRMLRLAWREQAACYHIHDPELVLLGLLLKALGKEVVYDAHENLGAQVLSKDWIPRGLRRVVSFVVGSLLPRVGRHFDTVVAATPGIAATFPRSKLILVQNFPRAEELVQAARAPHRERPPKLAYVGGLTEIRGAVQMVRSLELIPKEWGAQLVIAGSVAPQRLLAKLSREPGWKRVDYLDWVSREVVRSVLAEARAGLVLFQPVPNHIDSQPTKLFEYMSAGIPVVASDFPLWRRIIEGAQCGLLVNPKQPNAIADAIAWVLQHPDEAEEMGDRGRDAVLTVYNWDHEAEKLLALYRELLA